MSSEAVSSRTRDTRLRDGDVSLSDDDALLRADIRRLGRILGDTVRDQEGADVFDLVERIRQTSIRFHRDDDKPARRELETILDGMSIAETVPSCVRSVIFRILPISPKTKTTSASGGRRIWRELLRVPGRCRVH